ncbi:PhzF family phenazine biosynthesis isomerase [Alicyclobacillus fastidiosus]|uniref:PhzF family phenazine biosynthesis isomerase n=1 Tax=Alicyclobacillus fastidiosus TaxID=392011 RepID=A0ABY6ZMY0_9BACL|nr:PhzF family phenazine biosynthesis isomerase [Alicyclobacillus fastidiosus]WAH43923.1 PhzF family phenazine biosynthesis isomerase [Alicyclobacillus fastidiosus]GMA60170.1 putative isomerase YfhB [Alicyclobacillus fastidiosus]
MKRVKVSHYNAFSTSSDKGNPAGVVLAGDTLNDAEMLRIAEQVGFNETVFIRPSGVADIELRYFTPGHEMNLCGHATIASVYALQSRGLLKDGVRSLTIETKAGVLPITIRKQPSTLISMQQASPAFIPYSGSLEPLASVLGIGQDEIHPDLPIVYGSTGIWTLLIPIRRLETFHRMAPSNRRFPSVLAEMPNASVHPFSLETHDPSAHLHGRHFSSPYSGTIEDPVTGTASGVMGAYFARFVNPDLATYHFVVEQGHEMNRDGRVYVDVERVGDGFQVSISGEAVFVRELDISL